MRDSFLETKLQASEIYLILHFIYWINKPMYTSMYSEMMSCIVLPGEIRRKCYYFLTITAEVHERYWDSLNLPIWPWWHLVQMGPLYKISWSFTAQYMAHISSYILQVNVLLYIFAMSLSTRIYNIYTDIQNTRTDWHLRNSKQETLIDIQKLKEMNQHW